MAHNINHLKTETSAGLDTSWNIKKPKNTNKGDALNYGTMKNQKDGGGTNYFSMNYKANKNNAQDANTESTFKDPDGVAMAGGTFGLNDGHMNYGTPVNQNPPKLISRGPGGISHITNDPRKTTQKKTPKIDYTQDERGKKIAEALKNLNNR